MFLLLDICSSDETDIQYKLYLSIRKFTLTFADVIVCENWTFLFTVSFHLERLLFTLVWPNNKQQLQKQLDSEYVINYTKLMVICNIYAFCIVKFMQKMIQKFKLKQSIKKIYAKPITFTHKNCFANNNDLFLQIESLQIFKNIYKELQIYSSILKKSRIITSRFVE